MRFKPYAVMNFERIGAGGLGVVYRAYQPSVGREVAVKVVLPEYANHPDFIRRFETEARLIARLEHLHIVPLTAFSVSVDGAIIQWQVTDQPLDELVEWVHAHRYVRELTCDERAQYRVEPPCDTERNPQAAP